MEKSYKGALVMPNGYVDMNYEEIINVVGGLNLPYKWYYAKKTGAMAAAASLKNQYGWNNISTYDLGAEIFTHAYAYYNYGGFLALAASVGVGESAAKSILNGIDVENKLDTKTLVGGMKRYQFYRAFYPVAPSLG